jgi:ribosomal protein S12 methylthiotransferase
MLGTFTYSQEEGTPSHRMKEQVPDHVKDQRNEALMLAQQQVAFELADTRVGKTFDVLVDGPRENGLIPARHAGQAPQVDSQTFVTGRGDPTHDPASGSFVAVRCTRRQDYDLIAAQTRVPLSVVNLNEQGTTSE